MAGWFAKMLSASRYAMNLKLLEADLLKTSSNQHANVIVAAAAFLEKISKDDFTTGTLLSRAVLEPFGTSEESAKAFYNTIEDVLNATEAQRKKTREVIAARHGENAAQIVDQHLAVQHQSLRLLLVALARKADDRFKIKARSLRECLCEAQPHIADAVAELRQFHEHTSGMGSPAELPDFEVVEVQADLFCFACVGW